MLIKKLITLREVFGSQLKFKTNIANDLFSESTKNKASTYKTYWSQDSKVGFDLPRVIIASKDNISTLFADIATYYPHISPISAYCHILSDNEESLIDRPDDYYRNNHHIKKIEANIWVALILMEAATASNVNQYSDEIVTYSLCKRTLSFALARAFYLPAGYNLAEIATKWLKLREISKLDANSETTATVLWIFSLIFNRSSDTNYFDKSEHNLSEYLYKYSNNTISEAEFLDVVIKLYPRTQEYIPALKGDFDGRMTALTKIIDVIRLNARGKEIDSLTIAFFCNLILSGSLSYVRFLARYQTEYPSILIWYGVFSGLSDNFDFKSLFSGIGQKLIRDITQPQNFEIAPTADISLDELTVLSRVSLKSSNLKPIQQRLILVSLAPNIEVLSRLPIDNENYESIESHLSVREELRKKQLELRDRKIESLLREAQSLIRDANFSEPTVTRRVVEKPSSDRVKPKQKN